ncbi:MAG: glycerol-3-phosphate 1-O-acyltransferase PlsY [Oscillospiraceae bacterium]|nr:glycerol-3-phosphate 1-O-acyltransferase PlsY [Oscillospiraceae bacterium]
MLYVCLAFSIIIPYLICSINPAIIAAKIKHGKDIREMGSGNPGLTNTLRTMGKRAAGLVLLFDVLKGVVSIAVVWGFLYLVGIRFDFGAELPKNLSVFSWIAALASVIGHCYPIYYKFKGGKAVLITVATGLVINWLAALIALGLFILIVLLTKYVSLGSVIAATLYAVCTFIFAGEIAGIFCSAIAVLLIFKHKANIKRLIQGNEKKIRFEKEKQS